MGRGLSPAGKRALKNSFGQQSLFQERELIETFPVRTKAVIRKYSKERVKTWAEKEYNNMTCSQRRDFSVACVAYDETTGKYYYGRNQGDLAPGYKPNSKLYGDSNHKRLLPTDSQCNNRVGNCAEVDAVNTALNDGAKIENLHLTVITVKNPKNRRPRSSKGISPTKEFFGDYKKSCKNCTDTFKNAVKENYSGWTEED